MMEEEYQKLLAKAPEDHFSDEFLKFLKKNNTVTYEDQWWLIIRNKKYWTPENDWQTAFYKKRRWAREGWEHREEALKHLHYLPTRTEKMEWLIKAPHKRSVKLFHVHLINKQ